MPLIAQGAGPLSYISLVIYAAQALPRISSRHYRHFDAPAAIMLSPAISALQRPVIYLRLILDTILRKKLYEYSLMPFSLQYHRFWLLSISNKLFHFR
jgi:hypothetical protein